MTSDIWIVKSSTLIGSLNLIEIKELIKVSPSKDLKWAIRNYLTSYDGERTVEGADAHPGEEPQGANGVGTANRLDGAFIIDLSSLSKSGLVTLKVERISVWSPFPETELSPNSDNIQLNYYTLVDINLAKYLKRQIKIHSIEFGYKII